MKRTISIRCRGTYVSDICVSEAKSFSVLQLTQNTRRCMNTENIQLEQTGRYINCNLSWNHI